MKGRKVRPGKSRASAMKEREEGANEESKEVAIEGKRAGAI
jgi:hypothetical protein